MLISNGDLLITILLMIGLFQLFWLSVVLLRKGINPSQIRLSMLILFSIWILIWPAYDNTTLPLLSLALFTLPLLFSLRKKSDFARHLRLVWHTSALNNQQPASWLMILLSLLIGASLFRLAPELGFGLTLSLCFAWSAAELADNSKRGQLLGLDNNLQQTLAGHLVLILSSSLILAWSLQLYHNIDWQQFFITTLIVGLIGSVTRALINTGWNMPLTTLSMATALWLL